MTPTLSTIATSRKSVAPKKSACSEFSHLEALTSAGSKAAMRSSRCASIEPMSLSIPGFEAGARFEVLITAKPLGVSTKSSDGVARRRASATTRRAVRILTALESVYPLNRRTIFVPSSLRRSTDTAKPKCLKSCHTRGK